MKTLLVLALGSNFMRYNAYIDLMTNKLVTSQIIVYPNITKFMNCSSKNS